MLDNYSGEINLTWNYLSMTKLDSEAAHKDEPW